MTAADTIPAGDAAAGLAVLRRTASGLGAIDLSGGAPDVTLLPPLVRRAVAAAMMAAAPGSADPFPALLTALAGHAERSLGWPPRPTENLVAAPTASAGLAAVALGLLAPGDEVVLVEPAPPGRAGLLRRAGALLGRSRANPEAHYPARR